MPAPFCGIVLSLASLSISSRSLVSLEETEARARQTLQFFLDNAAVIDQPRNSFDIHPFSLDLRTEYAETRRRSG